MRRSASATAFSRQLNISGSTNWERLTIAVSPRSLMTRRQAATRPSKDSIPCARNLRWHRNSSEGDDERRRRRRRTASLGCAAERKKYSPGPSVPKRLAQQSEWLRITLASIGDAVISTDALGRVTFLNTVAEKLTGWSRADVPGTAAS